MSSKRTQSGVFSNLKSVGKIAAGGMGYVELARLSKGGFERFYAIKRLHSHLLEDAEVRDMFLDEARLAGLVRHPNVVSVLDVIEDDRGPALVMEYIDGISLSTMLERGDDGEDLPISFCVRMAAEAARGLHAAHELRDVEGNPLELVHRDVSPQNILLGRDGLARLTDFGVAKAMNRLAKTSTGILKGKFGYMAPEVLRFEEPDRRADIFALGVVLFESLTRRRLYKNVTGLEGARRVLSEPPPDLADFRDDVPPVLVGLLFSMLAKQPESRPRTAEEVEGTLNGVLRSLEATEGPIDSAELVNRVIELGGETELEPSEEASFTFKEASPRRWPIALVASLVLGLGAAAWWFGLGQAIEPAPDVAPPPSEDPPVEVSLQQPNDEEIVVEPAPGAPATPEKKRKPRKRRRSGKKAKDKKIPMWGWE
ncbi:MAG: protein kinase [Myxococcota bacterium]